MVRKLRRPTNTLGVTPSLLDGVVSAGAWNVALRIAARTIAFGRNIVLARILAPADFGMFGVVLLTLSIFDRFSATGLQAAIVQKKGDVSACLDVAWTVQALRGAALGLTAFVGAPLIAAFFEAPESASLLRVLAFVLILRDLQNPGTVHFIRALNFRQQFNLRLLETLADVSVSVACAFAWQSPWALMIGLVAGKSARLVGSYLLHPHRPIISWDLALVRDLSRFGRWVFLNNVITFLLVRGDNFFVAKFFGPSLLGVYVLAYSVSDALTVEISRILSEVAFPAYARLQDRLARMSAAFTATVDTVASLSLPAATVLSTLALSITSALFGPRWTDVAAALPPLAFAGALRAIIHNATPVYRAVGRPELVVTTNVTAVIAMGAALLPLAKVAGLRGVGFAVLVGALATIPVFVLQVRSVLGLGWLAVVAPMWPGALLATVVAIPLHAGGVPQDTSLTSLSVRIVGALGLYSAAAFCMWRIRGVGPLRVYGVLHRRWNRVPDAAVLQPALAINHAGEAVGR